jgi:hypothetical protein
MGALQQHRQPPPADPPSPDSTKRPKDVSILQRDIHLIEIKYCKDNRLQNLLITAQEQQKPSPSSAPSFKVKLCQI